jgi:exodeoxyribonuclease V beta subunit
MTNAFDPYRSPINELDDLLVVSASAGTGKTWMITHLATRWLLETSHLPSELLMVTFSRATAHELKSRLRQRMLEIGEQLDLASFSSARTGDAADDTADWIVALAELAESVGINALRARHRFVMSRLDEVNARTIHSFAAALRETSEAGVIAGGELRRRAVHEVLTRRITNDDPVILSVLAMMDSDGSKTTPGAERLAEGLVGALTVVQSAGGLTNDRVQFWNDTGSDLDMARRVEELLSEAWSRLNRLQELEQQTTFDQLISELHYEITSDDGALATRLRESVQLVLIDEFQDTDQLQWEIFDVAFRRGDDAVPIIVVGDPKQAIYGFRGGDVSVFQRVAHEAQVTSGSRRSMHLELSTNYRSSAQLLSGLDDLFSHANDVGWHFSRDEGTDPVKFHTVRASDAHSQQPGQLIIRHAEGVKSVDQSIIADVRAVVRSLVNQHGVAPSDIAVLCARQFTLTQLRRGFERDGFKTVSAGAVSVFVSDAAFQLRTLLWIIGDPRDPRRAALRRATWFRDIDESNLAQMGNDVSLFGVVAWARRTLSGELLARLRAQSEGERHWTDLEHLFDLLANESGGPLAPSQLLSRLDVLMSQAEAAVERNDDAQRRVESDDDALRLMTIHAAKGLEFPIVLIADVEQSSTSRGVSSWTSPNGRVLDGASLLGAGSKESPAVRAREDEARRLIYVALTRAERLCVLWGHDGAQQWNALRTAWTPAPLSGARRESLVGALDISDDVLPRRREPTISRAPHVRELPEMPEHLRRWSYSALNVSGASGEHHDAAASAAYDAGAWGEDLVRDNDDLVVDATLFDGLSGTTLGNAIHRVFETCVGHVASTDRTTLAAAINSAWHEHGLAPATARVTESFANLLARPLGEQFAHGSLDGFVGTSRVASEMRFTLPLGSLNRSRLSALCEMVAAEDHEGPFQEFFDTTAKATAHSTKMLEGFLTGSIDLVAETETAQGPRFVIVDYKSNRLRNAANFEPKSLYREMAHSAYPLQALLYQVALHRYLRGRWSSYDPAQHLGGVCYLYVRGAAQPRTADSGLATWFIPSAVVTAASQILAGNS